MDMNNYSRFAKIPEKKSPFLEEKSLFKVRRGWDSNPRTPFDVTSLAVQHHLSVQNVMILDDKTCLLYLIGILKRDENVMKIFIKKRLVSEH